MFLIIYIISVIYCIYKMFRGYQKRYGNDIMYATPGLETLAILVMAPVLMAVDASMTWIRLYKEAEEAKRKNSKIF